MSTLREGQVYCSALQVQDAERGKI
jgi:hypothetical protein